MHFEAFIHFQFHRHIQPREHPTIITSNFMNYELILLEWREMCGERKPMEKRIIKRNFFHFEVFRLNFR